MRLVFIHGRDQQGKNKKKLQKEWEATLEHGFSAAGLTWPKGVTVSFPYFGDALDKLVKQVDAPLITGVVAKGPAANQHELAFRARILLELARGAGITDKQIGEHYKGSVREKGLQNSRWVLAISRALDKTPMGRLTIDRLTRDVYVYLTFIGVRDQIDKIVAKEVYQGPCVVVAHSLGSVIAYQVLHGAPAALEVKLFETVGSPLGLNAVKDSLGSLAMPVCAAQWFNARDPKDIVALYALDAKHFPISPPIENLSRVKNNTSNHHGIDGYLDNPFVAGKIHAALTKP